MKGLLFNAVVLASISCAVAQDTTIGDYAGDIPSCSFKSFRKWMQDKECKVDDVDASSIDCLCRHLSSIAVGVTGDVDTQCSLDFAQAIGSVCGMYAGGYGSTASGFAEATSIIGEDLKGGGGGGAKPTATSGSQSSAKSAAAADATATSTNAAAVPTLGYAVAGLLGGAVIMAGELL